MSIKKWTTTKIKEVLDENYCRGVNGADYNDIKKELEDELYERENKDYDKQIEQREAQEVTVKRYLTRPKKIRCNVNCRKVYNDAKR